MQVPNSQDVLFSTPADADAERHYILWVFETTYVNHRPANCSHFAYATYQSLDDTS